MKTMPGEAGVRRLIIGWLEPGSSRKDAIDYARAYAQRHFDSPEISWYAVMPFMGGWFYEVHEGGKGKSYLPSVAKALALGDSERWIRVGTRAMSVSIRDGRPFCVLMAESDSKLMSEEDDKRLTSSGKMQRVIKRGTNVLLSGIAVATCGMAFLMSAGVMHYLATTFPPSLRDINVDLLPHSQWSRISETPINLYIERLELEEGATRWETVIRPVSRSQAPIPDIFEEIEDDFIDIPFDDIIDEVLESDETSPDMEDDIMSEDEFFPAPLPLVNQD